VQDIPEEIDRIANTFGGVVTIDISPFNPMKILYHRDKIEEILNGNIPLPVFLTIDPSNRCQHKCFFCFTDTYKKINWVDLKPLVFHQIISDFIKIGVKALAYCGGGEPLMNNEIFNVMKQVKEANIEQGLITNGGLLTNKKCNIILDTCKFIRISIDAYTDTVHRQMHGSKDFHNIIEQIEYMVENKGKKKLPEINVSYMLCPMNFKSIVPAVIFYKALGIDSLIFKYIYTTYNGIQAGYNSDDFIKDNYKEICHLFEKVESYQDSEFKINYRHPWTFITDTISHLSKLYNRCRVQSLAMAGIAATGDLYLCCDRRGETILGNIPKDGSFLDLWGSEKHERIFNNINLNECPQRCKATEHNIIIEKGFIENKFDWNMI